MELDPNVTRTALHNAEVEQIRSLAKQIRNSKHFKTILRDARPEMRRGVYDILVKLINFKVPSYEKLMKATLKKEKCASIK